LAEIEYLPEDKALRVRPKSYIRLHGREYFISDGLRGERIAVRSTETDGVYQVYFCHAKIRVIDVRETP